MVLIDDRDLSVTGAEALIQSSDRAIKPSTADLFPFPFISSPFDDLVYGHTTYDATVTTTTTTTAIYFTCPDACHASRQDPHPACILLHVSLLSDDVPDSHLTPASIQ